ENGRLTLAKGLRFGIWIGKARHPSTPTPLNGSYGSVFGFFIIHPHDPCISRWRIGYYGATVR
ncbi:hypothetical protein ACHAWU_003370, partial [Discostella pseudostelligera]